MIIHAGHIRAICRIILFALLCLFAAPVFMLAKTLPEDRRTGIVRRAFVLLRWLMGFRIVVHGRPAKAAATLYVANHLSYLDIPVLGSVIKCSFISRADVAEWPLFGWFSKQQRTIFTKRLITTAAAEAKEIRARLEAGDRLLMFPEGTSSDGQHLLPFKSTFFAVANELPNGTPITVQPISMALTEMGNLPIGRHQRPLYAWYGDMGFEMHFWHVLQLPGFTIDIRFHPTTTLEKQGGRKQLAKYCETYIADGLSRANSGRPPREATETLAIEAN